MGTYDRGLQWRMMQQRPLPTPSNAYFTYDRRTGPFCGTASDVANANMSNYYTTTTTDDHSQRANKRARGNATYKLSGDDPSRYDSGTVPPPYVFPTASTSSTTENYSSTAQEFPGEWFSARNSTSSSAPLSVATSSGYGNSSGENLPGAGSRSAVASPTSMFGVENIIADYESGFYSLWNNGPAGGSNVMGYDAETPSDRPSQSETGQVYLQEEELKLPDLNAGDLDYIYGNMEPSSGRTGVNEPLVERLYSTSEIRGLKRERSSEEPSKSSAGMMLSAPSSLISPLAPSGFRSLARNATIETKRPPARTPAGSTGSFPSENVVSSSSNPTTGTGNRRSSAASAAKRPRSRQCDYPGCNNRARSHQKCKKHGGAHQCVFEGCTKNSQSRGLCIAHGGGSRCKIEGCTRAAQSKGLCKSHGGGEYCAVEGCRKKAHLKHLCRTHGGGVRCKDPKCMKWAQRKGWCMAHAKEVLGT